MEVNAIITTNKGIIDVYTFQFEADALHQYIKKANEFGAGIEEDDKDLTMCLTNDMAMDNLITKIDNILYNSGHEVKWFVTKVQ
jgi:hypothetical protein